MTDPNGVAPAPEGASSSDDREQPIQLLDYWRILVERRVVVFACLAILVTAATLYSIFATREYEAVTTLQIERQGPEILNFKDIVSVDSSYGAYQDFFQTQYKILQSRTVIRIAAERLDLMNRPEFVSRRRSPIQRAGDAVGSAVGGATEFYDPLRPAILFIQGHVSIQPIRNSRLVKISFTDRDRALAADVANAVADAYQQFNFDARYSTTSQATEFLTKEVARIQQEIADLERKLQEYGQKKEILSLSDSSKDISQQALSDFNTRYVDAKGRLALSQARYNAVKEVPPESLPEVLNSPLISNLRQQYAEIERRHSQMSERFKPDWPPLQQLQQELDIARDRLRIESKNIASQVRGVAKADYDRVRGEVSGLEQQVNTQKHEVQRVNRDAIQYASLKAEIDTRRKVLADLVARQSQTATSERLADTRASNVRIVDRAEPPRTPVRPKKLVIFGLSVIFGLGLGVGLAFLLDHLDNTVKTEQDLERVAALPALGYVPLIQPLRVVTEGADKSPNVPSQLVDLASHLDPRSAFAEAFKNLRTSLLLASADRPPRTIVVTSAEPGDGKSTVALNLGIVLTQLGRRVLVVDADLRRPRLHRMLHISNAAGLSSYLSGNAQPAELIQDTEVPNLLAITSGPIPPNPSELLGASSLEALVERLIEEGRFDHVLLDSPPAVQVADSVILSSRMEATIIVVRAGKTSRTSVAQAAGRLRQARGRVIGAVLNAIQESGSYYYYRYKYYRHYGEESRAETKTAVSRWRRGRRRAAQA